MTKIKKPNDLDGKPMLNTDEIAEYLGVNKCWISKMCGAGIKKPIPYRRIGKNYWFITKQVDEWNTTRTEQCYGN